MKQPVVQISAVLPVLARNWGACSYFLCHLRSITPRVAKKRRKSLAFLSPSAKIRSKRPRNWWLWNSSSPNYMAKPLWTTWAMTCWNWNGNSLNSNPNWRSWMTTSKPFWRSWLVVIRQWKESNGLIKSCVILDQSSKTSAAIHLLSWFVSFFCNEPITRTKIDIEIYLVENMQQHLDFATAALSPESLHWELAIKRMQYEIFRLNFPRNIQLPLNFFWS